MDSRLIALDERSGKLLWSTLIGDADAVKRTLGQVAPSSAPGFSLGRAGQYISASPAYANGVVIVGLSNGDFGIRGRIVGVDSATGRIRWRFYTIPAPNEAGHETWPADSDVWKTGGGGVWMTPAVDTQLGLTYVGIGNPVPQWGGEARAGDNLYTNSVVALDIRSGRLRWHYQLVHHDIWDHDLGTPLVFDTDIDGRKRQGIAVMRTDGFLFQLDRATGQPLTPIEERPVPQKARLKTAATQPFPVGADSIAPRCVDPAMVPKGFLLKCYFDTFDFDEPNAMFPYKTARAAPMAFSPRTQLFYATAAIAPTWLRRSEDPYYMETQKTRGMQSYGLITALDRRSGKITWQQRAPLPIESGSGVTATAGNLVFHGEPGGELQAFDAKSGHLVWSFQTGAGVNGPIAAYEVNGTQFVAVAAGEIWAFTLSGTISPRRPPPALPNQTDFAGPVVSTSTISLGANLPDFGVTGTHLLFDEYAVEPTRARVLAGTEIKWVNNGKEIHTMTAEDGSWTTGPIAPGHTVVTTIPSPGDYVFIAAEFPWSAGELIVRESNGKDLSDLGARVYRERCAVCHLVDMSGRAPAPELLGAGFLSKWTGRTGADLYEKILTTMPLGAPNSLSDQEYLEIATLILDANQVPGGTGSSSTLEQLKARRILAP
jgi:outer membrane protein assembly factor BamB/mono/diheme cytochrome c family protein